jgi:hypothetical protein
LDDRSQIKTRTAHSGLPRLMAPKMGTEIFKPDEPRRRYLTDCSLAGIVGCTGSVAELQGVFGLLLLHLRFSVEPR